MDVLSSSEKTHLFFSYRFHCFTSINFKQLSGVNLRKVCTWGIWLGLCECFS